MKQLSLAALALAGFALTGCVSFKQSLPPEGREVAGGRNALVTVAQSEINAGIRESNMAGAMGGGLLMALIDTGVNNARAKTAETAIVPVRDALADYNFDAKAMQTTESLERTVPWLAVKNTELNKDVSNARFTKALDAAPGKELLTITYDYQLDNNFQELKVGANVSLLPTKKAKGEKADRRMLLTNADFTRAFVCVISLSNPSKDINANAAVWARNGGAQTEAAVDLALAKLVLLMQKGLELTPAQEKQLKAHKTQKVGTEMGKIVEKDADGVLLMNAANQWVYVFNQTVRS